MKKIVFAALAMSLASSLAAQPKQTLSFDEALNLTLTNNPSIKASTYEQEAAERERKAAYGLRLPKIGVTGAYAYLSEDINIDLNGMKEPVGVPVRIERVVQILQKAKNGSWKKKKF